MTTRHARIALLVAAVVVVAACGSGTGAAGSGGSGSGGPGSGGSGSSSSPTATGPLWGPPGTGAIPANYQRLLQSTLDRWVDIGKLAGATAAVVTPAGVWAGAAGVDGAKVPLQPDSAMWIASTSKTFTAAEVMLLASRGLVDLDAPLSTYVEAPFDTKGTTVRQALAMRTGFPDYQTKPYQQTIAKDLQRDWTPDEMLATMPADAPRVGTAGGTPYYNSIGYVLLGELIAKVSKRSTAAAIRADLLDPAGLHRTWVQTAETPTAPLSVGTNTKAAKLVDPAGPYLPSRSVASFTSTGGGMAGDAADLARWGYLLYGGQVINSDLVKHMEADPQTEPSMGPYALGTTVNADSDGTVTVGHPGGGLNWPYTAMMEVWTGSPPVAVVVLTPQPADFATQLFDLVVGLHSDIASLANAPKPTTTPTN